MAEQHSGGDELPISVKGLSKTYQVGFWMNRKVRALQGLDLEVGRGQIYGLLGPNGAGKSTTIKILMNLVRASEGSASLFGKPADDPAMRRRVGFLPENPAPYEYLTGLEFVTFAGQLSGLSGVELDRRVKEVLGQVEMSGAEKLQIRRYSKGMVQRVALAQALVARPSLLILDEPTSGLDPIGRRQMRELILAERERGTTVLFCSHIISDVESLCDRLAMLVGGRRVREGAVTELLSRGQDSVELTFQGISRERLTTLAPPQTLIDSSEGGLLLRVGRPDSQPLLAAAMAAGAQVLRVQPARASLEQLFLEAVKEAGRSSAVGGEIST